MLLNGLKLRAVRSEGAAGQEFVLIEMDGNRDGQGGRYASVTMRVPIELVDQPVTVPSGEKTVEVL